MTASSKEPRLPTDLRAASLRLGKRRWVVISYAGGVPEWAGALSEAEAYVAREMLAGRSNAEIARARGTSIRTVANQVARVFRKLGVHGRFEFVARAVGQSASRE